MESHSSTKTSIKVTYLQELEQALQKCAECGFKTDERCWECELARVVLWAKCESCGMISDIWKYGGERAEGRCPNCGENLMALNSEELEDARQECEESGCINEVLN